MLVRLDLFARLGSGVAAYVTNEDGRYDRSAAQELRKTLDVGSDDDHWPFFDIQMECFETAKLEGWRAAYEAARSGVTGALEN
ncbi:hypothetical protein [Candidatus Palauibacter sp.]|uniref:hypothetical protein n=1 Tax=Candidatus Palauibacter sp. TaxID=3101350 RepID=UPI003CC53F5B